MNESDYLNNSKDSVLGNYGTTEISDCSHHKKTNLLLIMSLLAIIAFSLSFVLTYYLNRPPELVGQIDQDDISDKDEMIDGPRLAGQYTEGFYTFLVVGTDDEDYHTDTIMVISLDTVSNKVNIVSIPRDTQVDVSRNPKKINSAYIIGGVKQLNREIKSILGFSPHYHIAVSLEAFEKLVDTVGGVEFDVPQDMNKIDRAQDLYIHLKKGVQLLDGDKALQLVRYREYYNADIGRIEVQQRFLIALAHKLLRVSNVSKIDEFIDIFKEHVDTNLSLRDMQWFARKALQLDPKKDIAVHTLPSSGFGNYKGHDYVYLDAKEVINMVNQTVNPYIRDIAIEDITVIRLED